MESQFELSKSPDEWNFDRHGSQSVSVFYFDDRYFYCGGGVYSDGGTTRWHPFFDLPGDSSDELRGRAIVWLFGEFTLGVDPNIGTSQVLDDELMRMSGVSPVSKFYKKAKYCNIVLKRGESSVRFSSMERVGKPNGTYQSNGDFFSADLSDHSALGEMLDKALAQSN